jgi:hypothetical protein
MPPAGPVGTRWFSKFMQDHPELCCRTFRPVDVKRRLFELNDVYVNDFFDRYEALLAEKSVSSSDIWNADETGFRIGTVSRTGNMVVVILRNVKGKTPEITDFGNRESGTLVAAASAGGEYIPAYLIFKTEAVEEYAAADIDPDTRFAGL